MGSALGPPRRKGGWWASSEHRTNTGAAAGMWAQEAQGLRRCPPLGGRHRGQGHSQSPNRSVSSRTPVGIPLVPPTGMCQGQSRVCRCRVSEWRQPCSCWPAPPPASRFASQRHRLTPGLPRMISTHETPGPGLCAQLSTGEGGPVRASKPGGKTHVKLWRFCEVGRAACSSRKARTKPALDLVWWVLAPAGGRAEGLVRTGVRRGEGGGASWAAKAQAGHVEGAGSPECSLTEGEAQGLRAVEWSGHKLGGCAGDAAGQEREEKGPGSWVWG